MARRFLILLILLVLLPQVAFAAEPVPPLPARQNAKTSPSPATARAKLPPLNILSIIPAQGEPGVTVTLYGGGFSEKTTVFLGNMELPAKGVGPKQLSFEIPRLDPGLYALYLKREDGATSRPYNFTLLPLKPVAVSLSPDTIYACATANEREVVISGRNFREGSQAIFDGAAVRTQFHSSDSLSFAAPQVADGLHQVQVRNPDNTFSGVLGLVVDGRPEVTSVDLGEQYVNYYNLVIQGRNFQQTSTLIVTEDQSVDQYMSQQSVITKRVTSLSANSLDQEQLLFVNCNRVVYQRYPYSTTPKNLRIQVTNPVTGGESSVVSVSAP
ncbi:MAG: transcription factor [Geobacter sp.]|nr:MAG: transcription factor [Geobacter sp.]